MATVPLAQRKEFKKNYIEIRNINICVKG